MNQQKDWEKNKEVYRTYCQSSRGIPLFFQDWWLDTVCGEENWQVGISQDKGGSVQGVLPFFLDTFLGLKVIRMPKLTPYLGVHLEYPQNLKNPLSIHKFQKRVTNDLIEQLPKVAYYAQLHPLSLQDWLPFKWTGFDQMTRYTYLISKEKSETTVWKNMDASVRNKIRKAEAYPLQVESSEDIELFYQINQKSFDRQAEKIPYSLEFIKQLDQTLKEHKQREILFVRDEARNIHAAIYLVWDDTTFYNLMLGANSALRSSGAVQLLLWKGIQKALRVGKDFDFEGGMIESIEPIFKGFGGELRPYHKISKAGNRFFRILAKLR